MQITPIVWALPLIREGDFREVDEPRFLATYLGVDGIRLEIIGMLRGRDWMTINEIAATLEWSRNGIQKHLDLLEDVGILRRFATRLPGAYRPSTCYRIDVDRIAAVADAVKSAFL